MNYFLAALPILAVLVLMLVFRWGGQRAGPLGWAAGLAVAFLAFGLNWNVFWVSQLKGLTLALFVLAILWPALFLYHLVDGVGGIKAIALGLENAVGEPGILLLILAWAFSSVLESLAGFGLPIAVVAPMLVGLGVEPVIAVAAVAVGHSWSVTFGDVGVVFQTLVSVVGLDPAYLAPAAALMMGVALLACGLGAAILLKQGKKWPVVLGLGLLMAVVQYLLAVTELRALAVFVAGLAGIAGGILVGRFTRRKTASSPSVENTPPQRHKKALTGALASYGLLTILLTLTTLIKPLNNALHQVIWQMNYPEVATAQNFITAAGHGTVIRPFLHPGTYIFLTALITVFAFWILKFNRSDSWKPALACTYRSALPASVGVISMVCLSTLMDHSGMTMLLAQGLSNIMGAAFPLVSPFIGILGAFATGSNNNSNVLFAPLQKNAALILGLDPRLLLAAQTTGGALGSMLAPAKLIVGCSTTGLKGRDGEVLRHTLVYGLVISLGLGVLALLVSIL